MEAHIIDERSEWRTFGDKEKEGDDPSRVGAAANPLLQGGGLTTGIAKLPGSKLCCCVLACVLLLLLACVLAPLHAAACCR